MDNLDKIKFKHSISGWLFKIDGSGRTEFKEGTKFVEELQAWLDLGNEIEPQFTAEELAEKEINDLVQALESQKSRCIQLRREAEYHFSPNPRFKDLRDVEKWRIFCDQLDVIIESNEIQEIPEKPFS